MRAAPGSEFRLPDADARAAVFAIFADVAPMRSMGVLWDRLKVSTRATWCRAACIDGITCMAKWGELSRQERSALYVALGNMIDFFEEADA